MYQAIFILLLLLSVGLYQWGRTQSNRALRISGACAGVFTFLLFPLMGFYGELLWFQSVGYSQRFWTAVGSQLGFFLLFGVIAWAIIGLLTWRAPCGRFLRSATQIIAAAFGAGWGLANWDTLLKYMYSASTSVRDPILNQESAFYLFHLPLYNQLFYFLLASGLISLGVSVLPFINRTEQDDSVALEIDESNQQDESPRTIYPAAAFLLFVLGWGLFLERYQLLYSEWGLVSGAGWTDVHIRLPAYWILVVCFVLGGLSLLLFTIRPRLQESIMPAQATKRQAPFYSLACIGAGIAAIWVLALGVAPSAVQWLAVEPNEISMEAPYIENNIRFTRKAFHLDKVEERSFPADESFTSDMIEQNRNLFNNIRLWDYRALDSVYKQFQEIRLYYEFNDVDIDRYRVNDQYREVMVSAREIRQANLPEKSQTFVNRVFKYTHGYGVAMSTVSDFTPQGLPNFWINDIPPKHKYSSLKIDRPEVYYGELTDSYVVVNSSEQEFDYPKGGQNMYTRYAGSGGVELSNLWRTFVYGAKLGGTRLFLTGYPTDESRIMFHRNIRERVKILAPFLHFDEDPYIVLIDGELHWIIDGYTASDRYPYSVPFSSLERIEYRNNQESLEMRSIVDAHLHGVNYIRNSVKAVVNAYNGDVDFYVYEPDDPIIKTWQNIFPDLFRPKEEMSESFQRHVRYPADMLLVQGLVYAKYHMTDPEVFYNQEDLWVRATEKYYGSVQPVQPYYVMWEPPETDEAEFVLILPFTPKNRQVLIGWIAGMCDPDNYGRFLAYQFPKEKRVLGPQQVETKIDQDRFLSGQLTLWDQRGSNVIRGNVLAIPIENTILYVEPIYLQAETAAYPELRLVALMHNDRLAYAETFDQALQNLLKDQTGGMADRQTGVALANQSIDQLIEQAHSSFNDYIEQTGNENFQQASESLNSLKQTLKRLLDSTTPEP